MISHLVPTEIVNNICEYAAGINKLWYPYFNPSNGKLIWKLNKHCKKYKLKIIKIFDYFYSEQTLISIYLNGLQIINHQVNYLLLPIVKRVVYPHYFFVCTFIHDYTKYDINIRCHKYDFGSFPEWFSAPTNENYIYASRKKKYKIIDCCKPKNDNIIIINVKEIF